MTPMVICSERPAGRAALLVWGFDVGDRVTINFVRLMSPARAAPKARAVTESGESPGVARIRSQNDWLSPNQSAADSVAMPKLRKNVEAANRPDHETRARDR